MDNKDCIFCKIVKEELPATKVWEDKNHIAILDINPSTRGHTLIFTKKHYETIFDMSEKEFEGVMNATRKVALLLKQKLNAEGINLLNSNGNVAQQEIPHVHIHAIPRYEGQEFRIKLENKTQDKNLEKVKEEILR